MIAAAELLLTLTAEDVMSRDVLTVSREMSLRDATHRLRCARITEAPVVDELGRCVGMLSARDVLRWVEEGSPGPEEGPIPSCAYQVKGRLLTGEDAVICTLAEGSCPLQAMRPLTEGRHVAVCRQPYGVLADWQQVLEESPGTVSRYMTTEVVSATPRTPLLELAQTMADVGVYSVPILDQGGRPVGIVSAADLMAAMRRHPEDPETTAQTYRREGEFR